MIRVRCENAADFLNFPFPGQGGCIGLPQVRESFAAFSAALEKLREEGCLLLEQELSTASSPQTHTTIIGAAENCRQYTGR